MKLARIAVIALLGIVLVSAVACRSAQEVITYCSSGCQTSWLGDGTCQNACNNAACYYDNGDCGSTPTPTPTPTPTSTPESTPISTPTPTLEPTFVPTATPSPTPTPTPMPTPAPTATSTPDCEKYDTAVAMIENHSLRSSYDIFIDGIKVGSITPGQAITQTVSAASAHPLLIKFSSTEELACAEAQINIPKCSTHTIWCDADQVLPTPTPIPDTTPPTLLSISWIDAGVANGIIDAGDQLIFYFSEGMDTSLLNEMSTINYRLESTAGGTANDYGSTGASAAWSLSDTALTVTLGTDCSDQLAGKAVNPSSSVKDKAGNADATVGPIYIP